MTSQLVATPFVAIRYQCQVKNHHFNSFHVTGLFLCFLKTSENQKFSKIENQKASGGVNWVNVFTFKISIDLKLTLEVLERLR